MPLVEDLWWDGVRAVSGRSTVSAALAALGTSRFDEVLAVGKAASAMVLGARERLERICPTLVVTKPDHGVAALRDLLDVEIIEAGHPVPNERSLHAGNRLLERVQAAPKDARVLLLISGGASALAERLVPGMSLLELQRRTEELVASGLDIHAINEARRQWSLLKGGRLLRAFRGAELRVLAISDVEGDDLTVIGSGLGDCRGSIARSRGAVIASNADARRAVVASATRHALPVRYSEESLYGNVRAVATTLAQVIADGPSGLYIAGGETTVELPPDPGRGGRNQSLALALALELAHRDVDAEFVAAGTDGTDGPTHAAGGVISTRHFDAEQPAHTALAGADAGTYLANRGALFVTGPTDTNVMDLCVCLKR
ncbi:MAG: DUF4147 domain-containing protein [Pseudomonadota bacterium]